MFQFEVHTTPVPQKQTRFNRRSGHCYDPSSKDRQFIEWQVKPFAPETPLEGAVELTIVFFLPIPKATSKAMRAQMLNRVIVPIKKPDVDNLAYLVTNALKNIVYKDDSQVVAQHIYKFYGNDPKTVIRVRPILQAEPLGYRDLDDVQ